MSDTRQRQVADVDIAPGILGQIGEEAIPEEGWVLESTNGRMWGLVHRGEFFTYLAEDPDELMRLWLSRPIVGESRGVGGTPERSTWGHCVRDIVDRPISTRGYRKVGIACINADGSEVLRYVR